MKIEIPLKQWLAEEGMKIGITPGAVHKRLLHGKRFSYPKLKLRRIGYRTVNVIL